MKKNLLCLSFSEKKQMKKKSYLHYIKEILYELARIKLRGIKKNKIQCYNDI